MPWITQIRVADSRTVSPKQYESARAEREFIVSFSPGELSSTDEAKIKTYCREMEQLVKLAIEEGIGFTSDVREPSKTSAPPRENAPASDATKSAPSQGSGLRDRYGNEWDKEIKCKECGITHEVKANKKNEPFAICSGKDDAPHEPYFLKRDGSKGNPAKPLEDK